MLQMIKEAFTWKFTSEKCFADVLKKTVSLRTTQILQWTKTPLYFFWQPASSLPAWKEFYSWRLEQKLQWFKREWATVRTIMPYIAKCNGHLSLPTALWNVLTLQLFTRKMQRQLVEITRNKNCFKGLRSPFAKWFICGACKIMTRFLSC